MLPKSRWPREHILGWDIRLTAFWTSREPNYPRPETWEGEQAFLVRVDRRQEVVFPGDGAFRQVRGDRWSLGGLPAARHSVSGVRDASRFGCGSPVSGTVTGLYEDGCVDRALWVKHWSLRALVNALLAFTRFCGCFHTWTRTKSDPLRIFRGLTTPSTCAFYIHCVLASEGRRWRGGSGIAEKSWSERRDYGTGWLVVVGRARMIQGGWVLCLLLSRFEAPLE